MTKIYLMTAGLSALLAAGCGNSDSAHLIFGEKLTVGLTIGASAPEQDAELSLGFRSEDLAIVPVAIKQQNGNYGMMRAGTFASDNKGQINDAFSTLAQFEMASGKNGTASVGLGKFFATGNAAQRLAEGFAARLGKKDQPDSRQQNGNNGQTGSSETTSREQPIASGDIPDLPDDLPDMAEASDLTLPRPGSGTSEAGN